MGRVLDEKCQQCRRAGEKLFLKGARCYTPNCAMVKRNYPPGFHGPKQTRRKLSGYGEQLNEKQKAKRYYNVMEKQFRLTFKRASKMSGDYGKNFLRLLESRLDNVIFRLGFASSRGQARQLVNHGHFEVDGVKTDIPSFVVKPGQEIRVRDKAKKNSYFKQLNIEEMQRGEIPAWLNLDLKEMKAKILHQPGDDDLPNNINVQMIIEYYSK